MAIPNLINITSYYGKTTSTSVGTAITVLVSNPANSNKSYKIVAIYAANVDLTTTAHVSIDFYRSSTSFRLVDKMSIVPGDSLVAMSRDNAIFLEEGDSLRCYSDQNDLVHITVSYEVSA